MTDTQFADLYHFLRFVPPVAAVLLLVEWIAWLAFLAPPYRWGFPYIQRTLHGTSRALPKTRMQSSNLILVAGRDDEWLFRPPYHFFKIATPFPLFGHVVQSADRLEVVGRHPFGGVLFFGAIVAQQLLLGFAPLFVTAVAARGHSVDLGALGSAALVLILFYGGSLALERYRFLKAVGEISALADGGNERAA